MKTKIVLVMFFIVTILCSTVAIATGDVDLDSNAILNANIEDLVGEDVSDTETTQMPISDDLNELANQGDLFILETNVNVEEDVNGNLYVLGDNVNISANVDGNVFVLGKNVTLKSNIVGSAYIAAENFKFEAGNVRDAYFIATNISMSEETIVSREAKMLAENELAISGMIFGNAYTSAQNIIVNEKGGISGNLVYTGNLEQAYEGQIGSIQKIEEPEKEEVEENVIEEKAKGIIYSTFTALFITGIIVLAINKKVEVKVTLNDCILGALKGLVFAIVIPIISIVLLFTIIGIPFSIILLFAYILMYFIVIPAVSVQISAYILNVKQKDSKVLLWLLATVVYCALAIVRQIPVLGVIVTVFVGTYGFNLIIKTFFSKNKKEEVTE